LIHSRALSPTQVSCIVETTFVTAGLITLSKDLAVSSDGEVAPGDRAFN